MKSKWTKWLAQPGHILAVSLDATDLMKEMGNIHNFNGFAVGGFSEAIIGTLLVSSSHKTGESININAQGSGYFKQAIVDCSPDGKVRGFMIEQSDPSMRTFGIEGNAGPWGTGILSVLYTKSSEGKVPYTGMVPISTGILDDAFNEYYKDSAQSTAKVGFFVDVKENELVSAHGVLIQTLGGANEDEVQAVSNLNVKHLRELAKWSADQNVFKNKLSLTLPGPNFSLVEETPVLTFCNCSQDRIERALILAGEDDMIDAIGNDPTLDVSCDFCCKQYKVSAERLKALYTKDRTKLQ